MEGIVTANNKALSEIDLSSCELTTNKVTQIKSTSTDTEYPSAKSIYTFASPKSSLATSAKFGTYATNDSFYPSCKAVVDYVASHSGGNVRYEPSTSTEVPTTVGEVIWYYNAN